jgi:hypothetical protein
LQSSSLPPPPLRLPEIFRRAFRWPGRGVGDVALLRGLKASGLAPLCLSSFSSGERLWGSLFERKLVVAELRAGRRGRNRSRDLREPLDLTLSLDWSFFTDGRENKSELLEPLFTCGSVEEIGVGLGSSEELSSRDLNTVAQLFCSRKLSIRRDSGVLDRLLILGNVDAPNPNFCSSPAPSNRCLSFRHSPGWIFSREDLFSLPNQDGA